MCCACGGGIREENADEEGDEQDEGIEDENNGKPELRLEKSMCTLSSVKRTWEIWSHMLDVAVNYPGHSKYKASSWLRQASQGGQRTLDHV